MSQNDFTIANQTFPNTRADINSALQALASTSSGTSAPSTTFANQFFYNTSSNLLQIRNEGNDAYITIAELDQTNDTVEYFKSDSIRTALIEFTDGDDALSIADGGALTTAGNLSIGGSNNELRFYEGANYVGFEAPALSADKIWVLPTADGTSGQALVTNGSGTLSFADSGGDSLRPNVSPLIINGDMAVNQRGTVTGIAAPGIYSLDRIRADIRGGVTVTMSQDTSVPTGYGFSNSAKLDVTTADSSLDANGLLLLGYHFEGQDLQLLKYGTSAAETVTVAFWIKSNKTGTFQVNLKNAEAYHIGQLVTISSADTWEKKVITFVGDTGHVITDAVTDGIRIQFFFNAGSDSSGGGVPSTWQSTSPATKIFNGNIALGGSTSDNVFITGLQFEVGSYTSSTLPPFQHESFGDNLARCQRYYMQSYSVGTKAGTASTTVGSTMVYIPATGNTLRYTLHHYGMRTTPTFAEYSPETGTAGHGSYEGSGDTNAEAIITTFANEHSTLLYNTAMGFVGSFYWQYTLNSEL